MVEGGGLGYPITLSPHSQPTAERRCARETDFAGSTGNRIPVPSVCEGSRFAGLGDVQGFVEKIPNFCIPY